MARTRTAPEGEAGFPTLTDVTVNPLALTGLSQPLWLQNSTYPAALDRQLITAAFRPGVVGLTELAVTQRAAGANFSVDVAAGRAVVPVTDAPNLGSALCASTAVNNLTVAGAPGAGLSRIDLVIARVYDASVIGGSINGWQLEIVTGTPAASPAAPALPASSLELARIAVASGQASVTTANITDRRVQSSSAGGPVERFVYTSPNVNVGASQSFTLTTFTMPFAGSIIAEFVATWDTAFGTSALVAGTGQLTTSTPAAAVTNLGLGPRSPASSYCGQCTMFGKWASIAAGTAVTIAGAFASTLGGTDPVKLLHVAGTVRLVPFEF